MHLSLLFVTFSLVFPLLYYVPSDRELNRNMENRNVPLLSFTWRLLLSSFHDTRYKIHDTRNPRLSTKKSLFPVQLVDVILASRAAANFFFFFFFWFGRKILSIYKINLKKSKNEKKRVPSRPFFRHPAAPPETDFLFRLAPTGAKEYRPSQVQSSPDK